MLIRRAGFRGNRGRIPLWGPPPVPPSVIFSGQDFLWLEPRQSVTLATPPDISGMTDQGPNGHDASQATDVESPHLVGTAVADFDGTDDNMILAEGSGWPARTSHSLFALVNRRAATATSLLDAQTGRLIFGLGGSTNDTIGYLDSDLTWRQVADTVTGWQILEWHLDSGSNTGEVIRTTATSSTQLFSDTYTGTSLGGNVRLGSNHTGGGRFVNAQLAAKVLAPLATVTQRDRMRRYLRHLANVIPEVTL